MVYKKGFTLIELLVVISIIALLSTLGAVSLNSARQRSRDARRVADMKNLQTALELYYDINNRYPIEVAAVNLGTTGNQALCSASSDAFVANTAACTTLSGNVYMSLTTPASPGCSGGSGVNYIYQINATGADYTVNFCLENGAGAFAAGEHTLTPAGIQ